MEHVENIQIDYLITLEELEKKEKEKKKKEKAKENKDKE